MKLENAFRSVCTAESERRGIPGWMSLTWPSRKEQSLSSQEEERSSSTPPAGTPPEPPLPSRHPRCPGEVGGRALAWAQFGLCSFLAPRPCLCLQEGDDCPRTRRGSFTEVQLNQGGQGNNRLDQGPGAGGRGPRSSLGGSGWGRAVTRGVTC